MSFAKDSKLETPLLQQIDGWLQEEATGAHASKAGEVAARQSFHSILSNAIDICADGEWLVSTVAIHVGSDPDIIRKWEKGVDLPQPRTQERIVNLIRKML